MIYEQVTNWLFEVIVIDSASTDGTVDIAGRFPVHLHQISQQDFNHGSTRQWGVELARGEYVAFLSQEAIFFDGNTPQRGSDAVEAAWARFFEDDVAPFSWHPDVVQVLDSGELALSSGPVLGPSGESRGRFNSIWRRDADGVWRIVFDKGS